MTQKIPLNQDQHIAVEKGTRTLCGLSTHQALDAWYGYEHFAQHEPKCPECLVLAGLLYDVEMWKRGEITRYSIDRCPLR